MFLQFSDSSCPESECGVALQELINKGKRFYGPSRWKFLRLDHSLFAEYLIPNLLSICASIRPPSHHKLIRHNSNCKVISGEGMIPPTHDLRRHVARSATCVLMIILPQLTTDSQVCNAQVALRIEDEVFRFEVTMEHSLLVEVLQAYDETGNEKFALGLGQSPLAEVKTQISSLQIIHDQIKMLPILKGRTHVDKKRMPQLPQKHSFSHDGADGFLGDDPGLAHLLHGQHFSILLRLHLPHLTESTFSNHAYHLVPLHAFISINFHLFLQRQLGLPLGLESRMCGETKFEKWRFDGDCMIVAALSLRGSGLATGHDFLCWDELAKTTDIENGGAIGSSIKGDRVGLKRLVLRTAG